MNPLIRRGIRERLRTKHLIASGLFSLILCSTIYLSLYLYGASDQRTYDPHSQGYELVEGIPANGARAAFTSLLIFQGFLLMFLGTGRVASVTAEEKESGLLDYQRMTPMNPLFKITGYLFGLPAREYFMFLITLPFLLHCIIVGQLPWFGVLQLYAVFFSTVLFYHLTAHVIGLVVPKPRAASWVSRIAVLGLYVFLPALGQAGISFLSFLTILPTYFGKMLPALLPIGESELGRFEAKAADFWSEIPFFTSTLSPTVFTFLMQGLILLTLLVTAHRKWRNQALPAFSKPSALALFATFQFLLLGCLWPFFSDGSASGLLGEAFSSKNLSILQSDATLGLVIVQTVFLGLSTLAILSLVNVCCPNLHLFNKGIQRAEKLGLPRVPHSADESSGLGFVIILGLLTLSVHAFLLSLSVRSEFWQSHPSLSEILLIPGLALLATCLYLQASRELWFNLGFWGFVGLLWVTPFLATLVITVGWQEEFIGSVLKILCLCPLSLLPIHLLTEYERLDGLSEELLDELRQAVWFGLACSLALAGYLQARLQLKRRANSRSSS